jgi:integrase
VPHKSDHLQLHGRQYRARVSIPADVRKAFGDKAFLIAPLGTSDLTEADRRKGEYVSRFKRQIAQARDTGEPILHDARMFRRWEEERIAANPNDPEDDKAADAQLLEVSEIIAEEHGNEASQAFYEIASGRATPLTEYFEEWIADRGFNEGSASHHRKAFAVIAGWCKSARVKATLEAITNKVAWQFRDKCLHVRYPDPKTFNNYLWSYRSHWKWLARRARVEANPWLGMNDDGRSTRIRDQGARKRPFTDGEIRALLSGRPPEPLHDLMMVAALSGARINAICDLRVSDCKGACFTFRRAKQEPDDRRVPIHSDLKEIVSRRCAGKEPKEFLFHECPEATAKRPRSAAASQAFTRYRRDLEVDERADWKRQSNVDFHSFRRWFTTRAEQAGQLPHIIDAVTGHKRPGETLGRYSQGPSMKQLRECVEAVKLTRLPAYARKVMARGLEPLAQRTRTVRVRKLTARPS